MDPPLEMQGYLRSEGLDDSILDTRILFLIGANDVTGNITLRNSLVKSFMFKIPEISLDFNF